MRQDGGNSQGSGEFGDLGVEGLAGIISVLSRKWKTLVAICGIVSLIAVGAILTMSPVYQATCTFISSSQITGESSMSSLGALSSAASRFGVDLRGAPGDLSPLYPWMLENREIGRQVLEAPFVDRNGSSIRLIDRLYPDATDSIGRFDRALNRLHRKVLNYSFDRKSGVTRVTASLDDPVLAANVANAFVEGLDKYNQGVMSDKAGSVAGFLEERLADFEKQIEREEKALRDFRTANRGYSQSPSLSLEESRLTRNLELAQQLYLSLRSQFEMVRMDEFKRLPRLTIIDSANPPYKKTSPRALSLVGLSALLGLVLGAAAILGRHQWIWYRRHYLEVRSASAGGRSENGVGGGN